MVLLHHQWWSSVCLATPRKVSLGLLDRLEDECLVDMGNDSTAGNGCLDQGVELFVSSDCELQVSWCDSLHLQVLAGVSC